MKKKFFVTLLSVLFILIISFAQRGPGDMDCSGSGCEPAPTSCAFDGDDCASGDIQCTSCKPVIITPE